MDAIENRPAIGRSRAWSARLQPAHGELSVAMLRQFDAEVRTSQLGALRFAQLSCRGHAIDRASPGDLVEASVYTLLVQVAGTGTLSQFGQHAELAAGDVALFESSAPHRHHMAAGSALLLVRIPARALGQQLPSAGKFCGRRLPAGTGMTTVTASLTQNLHAQALAGLPSSVHDCLSRQLLETIAVAFTHAFGPLVASQSVVGGRYARARLFIEQNLGEPDLGPHSVARALNVSARYLRMIFAREGECISSYVLRRRLEETARQLADPRWRGQSICQIAFTWGFNSAPHFSRSFREHYGMPPREYRLRHGARDGQQQPAPLAACG
jgi:AraC family transcriptional activator of tynA and feaB